MKQFKIWLTPAAFAVGFLSLAVSPAQIFASLDLSSRAPAFAAAEKPSPVGPRVGRGGVPAKPGQAPTLVTDGKVESLDPEIEEAPKSKPAVRASDEERPSLKRGIKVDKKKPAEKDDDAIEERKKEVKSARTVIDADKKSEEFEIKGNDEKIYVIRVDHSPKSKRAVIGEDTRERLSLSFKKDESEGGSCDGTCEGKFTIEGTASEIMTLGSQIREGIALAQKRQKEAIARQARKEKESRCEAGEISERLTCLTRHFENAEDKPKKVAAINKMYTELSAYCNQPENDRDSFDASLGCKNLLKEYASNKELRKVSGRLVALKEYMDVLLPLENIRAQYNRSVGPILADVGSISYGSIQRSEMARARSKAAQLFRELQSLSKHPDHLATLVSDEGLSREDLTNAHRLYLELYNALAAVVGVPGINDQPVPVAQQAAPNGQNPAPQQGTVQGQPQGQPQVGQNSTWAPWARNGANGRVPVQNGVVQNPQVMNQPPMNQPVMNQPVVVQPQGSVMVAPQQQNWIQPGVQQQVWPQQQSVMVMPPQQQFMGAPQIGGMTGLCSQTQPCQINQPMNGPGMGMMGQPIGFNPMMNRSPVAMGPYSNMNPMMVPPVNNGFMPPQNGYGFPQQYGMINYYGGYAGGRTM